MEALSYGGIGETYLAIDLDIPVSPKPKCVIKKLQPQSKNNRDIVRLFEEEAKVLYKLGKEHEQIPKLYAYFVEDDDFYLVQSFINGHDLSTEIDNIEYKPPQNNQSGSAPTILIRKQWEETAVIALLKEVLTLLVYIHKQGVIHRDIKPANLMRCHITGKLNIIDFGSVKAVSNQVMNKQGQTQLTVAIGTPGYIPTEQLAGRPNFSSDLYALGITAIQALTGFRPDSLPTEKHEIQWRKLATASDELATFLDKMIHFDCYQRYQSASEELEVLETIPIREPKLVKLNGEYGFVSQGKVVVPFQFNYADNFSEGLAGVAKVGEWGYINTQEELVIPYQFDYVDRFYEGLAAVKKNNEWGYTNRQGEWKKWVISKYDFSNIHYFDKGLALVGKYGKWGYINTQGELVIPYQFDGAAYYFYEGLAFVEKDGKWGFINTQGELVIPCQFDNANYFTGGLVAVRKDGKWGYINTQGELVIPYQFDYAYDFEEGLAKVKIDETEYLINRQGEIVYPKIGYNE